MEDGVASVVWGVDDTVEALAGEFDLPMIAYTPYAIFSNSIPIFDINFFSPNEEKTGNVDFGQGETEINYVSESSASILRSTIASWYISLRTLAFVGLLSVLIYIGIRIITGSVSDKAKYKERIVDWLVAMCLLFVLHYLMVFIVEITNTVGTLFASSCSETILVKLPTDTTVDGEQLEADPDAGYPIWACNFTGYSRLIAGGFSDYDTMKSIEFTLIYVVLVIYTLIFTVIYLKRVLYMAFLTMIAPLVALTYPIDKINDGKAQGFDTWLKEYIFNALMQPFHMLIYSIIIGSVMDLAIKYPIYSLVALGFLMPAEKMLRRMFGFEKAQSPTTMGALGLAGAGLLMSGINRLTHKPREGSKDGKGNGKAENGNVRMKTDDFDTLGNFVDNPGGINEADNPGGINEEEQQHQTLQQAMLDVYDEGFGTDAWDSQEREAMAREAYQPEGMNYSDDEYAQILRDSGYEDDEIESMVREMYGQPEQHEFTNNPPQRQETPKQSTKRTFKNKLGNGIMAVGTRYSNKFANSHPLRSLRRGVTYSFGAASLGMVGLAAGISTGDFGKAAQYTATAAGVGGRFGSSIGDSLSSTNRDTVRAFRQGWNGEEWANKQREKQIKEMQSNPDNVQYLRERTPDYRAILKDAYPEYAKYGCSNIEDFWAAYQLEQSGVSRSSAISTYQLAQRTGDISKIPDAESKWEERLDKEFGETEAVKSRQRAEKEKLAKQYELSQKQAAEEYDKQRKEIENSKRKNKEAELKKIQQERDKRMEELQKQHEVREKNIRTMPSQLTRTALDSVKQFYKNK